MYRKQLALTLTLLLLQQCILFTMLLHFVIKKFTPNNVVIGIFWNLNTILWYAMGPLQARQYKKLRNSLTFIIMNRYFCELLLLKI